MKQTPRRSWTAGQATRVSLAVSIRRCARSSPVRQRQRGGHHAGHQGRGVACRRPTRRTSTARADPAAHRGVWWARAARSMSGTRGGVGRLVEAVTGPRVVEPRPGPAASHGSRRLMGQGEAGQGEARSCSYLDEQTPLSSGAPCGMDTHRRGPLARGTGLGRRSEETLGLAGHAASVTRRTRSGQAGSAPRCTFWLGGCPPLPCAAPDDTRSRATGQPQHRRGEKPPARLRRPSHPAGRRRSTSAAPIATAERSGAADESDDRVRASRTASQGTRAAAQQCQAPPAEPTSDLEAGRHDEGEGGDARRLGQDRSLPHGDRRREREAPGPRPPPRPAPRARPRTVATDAHSAAQHTTAPAACRSTYRSPVPTSSQRCARHPRRPGRLPTAPRSP